MKKLIVSPEVAILIENAIHSTKDCNEKLEPAYIEMLIISRIMHSEATHKQVLQAIKGYVNGYIIDPNRL